MANKKITELTEATLIIGTDVLPIVAGGITKKVKADTLASFVNPDATLKTLSANWENTYTTVDDNSAKWESAYSTIASNSASYATINFTNNKFFPLSGGLITGNIEISGNATIVGNISATQNLFSGTNKSILTPQTTIAGVSSISNIVAVSALPVFPDPSTLYIVI
jgi:hypothetical protein